MLTSPSKSILQFVNLLVKRNDHYVGQIKQRGVTVKRVTRASDFFRLPIFDKKGYIVKGHIPSLWAGQTFPPVIYASSGSSGRPTYWYRGDQQEMMGADIHEVIFRDIFGITKNTPTLVVICFSMGVWVAGGYTLESCRNLARRGYRLSIITPGIEIEDILSALRELAPHYQRVVLAGYPPFVSTVLQEVVSRGIYVGHRLRVLCAGDNFSEEWRDGIMRTMGASHGDPTSIIGVYGSADATIMGHETPLTIFLRRAARDDQAFAAKLFGDCRVLPSLVQYDPRHIFIEEVDGELVVTTKTSLPLVRYNIHDAGSVLSYTRTVALLSDVGLLRKAKKAGVLRWKFPLVAIRGRTDVALTYFSLNVYPEHLKTGLENRRIRHYLSGNFVAFNSQKHGKDQKICVVCEMARGARVRSSTSSLVTKALVSALMGHSSEYRKMHSTIGGKRAEPKVKLIPFGFIGKTKIRRGTQGLLNLKGRKPKMLF